MASKYSIKLFSRHEDIREAMMSLVHMIRMSEDKLERHEFREKALGEQVKKMLGGLDKKHRALEPLKGMISRLDERLSNVETILLQVCIITWYFDNSRKRCSDYCAD